MEIWLMVLLSKTTWLLTAQLAFTFSKLTIDVVLVFLMLSLNIFHNFSHLFLVFLFLALNK